ncbi:hypothetical protein T12_2963 [Trichinella patagoniensis]|uniref:Uncharacterized protein n=1 Tax=Trichinella patagoniensis TaxID=990121 RepID=A0A0V1A2H6_9BILA|nr:hypothetical protein T12_2963 [Trichinella patagoniensis]
MRYTQQLSKLITDDIFRSLLSACGIPLSLFTLTCCKNQKPLELFHHDAQSLIYRQPALSGLTVCKRPSLEWARSSSQPATKDGVDWLVSLRGHLCWLPPTLLLLPPSSRFPDDIIPNRRQAESTVFIINYEQRPSTIRHRKLCKPTITTRSQRATHYRNPPLIFKYKSFYGSFLLTYLCT